VLELERVRESNRKMNDLFRDSSHLLYIPAFTAMKDFYYNSIPQDRFSTRSHKNEPDLQILSLSIATPYNDEPVSLY